jgi:flagellar biosynthesis protein FlhG
MSLMPSPKIRMINNLKVSPLANPVRVIAVTGGKGGVGKSTVAVNLATGLAAAGRRVVLLDEILVNAPQGFMIVPAASGAADLANLDATAHLGLVQGFSALGARVDVLIVDTAAGIAPGVLQFSQAAQQVLVVLCDEPASMTDAYALVKVLSRNHGVRHFRVLANMAASSAAGESLFRRFERVTARFLDVALEYAGAIPQDEALRRAVRAQRPVLEAFPASPAARAFKKLTACADSWPAPAGPRGNLEFFVERLIRRPAPHLEVVP